MSEGRDARERSPVRADPTSVLISVCDPLNEGFGYQIRIERRGETLLATATHPITGDKTLSYSDCLEIAAMYAKRSA